MYKNILSNIVKYLYKLQNISAYTVVFGDLPTILEPFDIVQNFEHLSSLCKVLDSNCCHVIQDYILREGPLLAPLGSKGLKT